MFLALFGLHRKNEGMQAAARTSVARGASHTPGTFPGIIISDIQTNLFSAVMMGIKLLKAARHGERRTKKEQSLTGTRMISESDEDVSCKAVIGMVSCIP